jgi:NADH:ubiquinone oxidoreductase subunit E
MPVETQSDQIRRLVEQAIREHGSERDALIPILNEINTALGYIPGEAYTEIKKQLHAAEHNIIVSESQLYGLASFYHMFSTKPLGKHVVRFCESAPCHVMGGRQVFQTIKEALGLEPGQTSLDGGWSLITTSCLGICGVGPVMLVDDDVYGNIRPDQVRGIFARYD